MKYVNASRRRKKKMSNKIAVTHPGKQGDVIYTIPAIRSLCAKHGCKADFYTSEYCAPLKRLFEAQDCIDHFYVSPNYVLERMDMGAQPVYVPVDATCYDVVYQLGYRYVPDRPLPNFIAASAGVFAAPIHYDIPASVEAWDQFRIQDYIVLAARGETSYLSMFREMVRIAPMRVVLIGAQSDGEPFRDLDVEYWTGADYLDTAYVISKARAFVGLMSSQLTLANGFPIPRIAPHDGKSWDMRHVVQSEFNLYPVNPTAQEVLGMINAFQ